MPKEFVESMFARPGFLLVGAGGDEATVAVEETLPAYRVAVGWGTNDYVQIASVDPSAEPYSLAAGLWVDLDRKGINDLIRLLRKARDRAYGRDE